jgi:hypothetical protein
VADPSTTQELEALEVARARLEAVLSGDENWRALRRVGADDTDPGGSAARQARNTRLEMALAGNAHYRAWKHLSGAIEALRERNSAQVSLGEEAAPLLPARVGAAGGTGPAQAASAGTSPHRLADRLGQLEGPHTVPIALSGEAKGRVFGARGSKDRAGPAVPAHPAEASVTFVVREIGSAAEPPPDSGATPRPASLLGLDGGVTDRPHAAGVAISEEAEVTIISAEGRRQLREAEERAGHVRRFRKALSGD